MSVFPPLILIVACLVRFFALQAELETAKTQLALVAAQLRDAKDGAAILKQDLDREVDTSGQLRQTIAGLERTGQEARRVAAEEASDLKVCMTAGCPSVNGCARALE